MTIHDSEKQDKRRGNRVSGRRVKEVLAVSSSLDTLPLHREMSNVRHLQDAWHGPFTSVTAAHPPQGNFPQTG